MNDLTNIESWMQIRPEGLYCAPADCFIDPHQPVEHALITHGHADHARPGHRRITATAETISIMQTRYPDDAPAIVDNVAYFEEKTLPGSVKLWFAPAGHILGSAQIVLEYQGQRIVISGDYKRHEDPTCKPFEVVKCDVFVTEATFALPVFSHPPLNDEISKVIRSLAMFPESSHLIGVYALGKCQRVMHALREGGYADPFYLHGALIKLTELYESYGMSFGDWHPVSDLKGKSREELRGKVVLCPPGSLADRWSRTLPDPVMAMASGWMQIRARARQRRAEMPLIVSDHADWKDLIRTCEETEAREIWITHGRVDALQHELTLGGIKAKALDLIGREEEAE
ncbi:MAG: ligase-associated DNA damage response exonuclease [Rhizobiaceae bacterium]|nr:ligase-associated DNA damage response exonuclease [Rhizobiaceae bacterium]